MGAERSRAAGDRRAGPVRGARLRRGDRRTDRWPGGTEPRDVLPALRWQARGLVRRWRCLGWTVRRGDQRRASGGDAGRVLAGGARRRWRRDDTAAAGQGREARADPHGEHGTAGAGTAQALPYRQVDLRRPADEGRRRADRPAGGGSGDACLLHRGRALDGAGQWRAVPAPCCGGLERPAGARGRAW